MYPQYSKEQSDLLLRKVPLVVWANFLLEDTDIGTISMNYVVPTLLDLANVETSPYYHYMLEMKKQVPIISSFGKYYDTEGNAYEYVLDDGMKYQSIVDDYFVLEYQNIQGRSNRQMYKPYMHEYS